MIDCVTQFLFKASDFYCCQSNETQIQDEGQFAEDCTFLKDALWQLLHAHKCTDNENENQNKNENKRDEQNYKTYKYKFDAIWHNCNISKSMKHLVNKIERLYSLLSIQNNDESNDVIERELDQLILDVLETNDVKTITTNIIDDITNETKTNTFESCLLICQLSPNAFDTKVFATFLSKIGKLVSKLDYKRDNN